MRVNQCHLAQMNVARALAPLSDPSMLEFVAQLDSVNQVADHSTGFVWRLKAEDGGASSYIRFTDDERMLVNMSVWTSIDALYQYAYRSGHVDVFRNRQQWFEPSNGPSFALWWVPAGDIPTVEEGARRIRLLKAQGPTVDAFTFKHQFPKPHE